MRKILAVAAIAVLTSTAAPAIAGSGPSSPTIGHDNPSSCLGAERAGRNSNGGDREHGGMNPSLTDWIHYLNDGGNMSWGEYNVWWKSQCVYAPGGSNDSGQ